MSKEKLYIFDTTLRDGAQTQGVDFSIDDKLKIAKALDDLGVDYIEGGWPGANPTDTEFFNKKNSFKHSNLTAFGMTKKTDHSAENDPMISSLINSIFAIPLLSTDTLPSVPLFANSISLKAMAENGIISLCDVNSHGSVNFTLFEYCVRSPNIISTTFSSCLVVAVLRVKSLIFSNALCAFKKPLINSSSILK